MLKTIFMLAALTGLSLCLPGFIAAEELQWEDLSAGNNNFTAVLVDRINPQTIYAASERGILKSQDAGLNWDNIFLAGGRDSRVNMLSFGEDNGESIYAGTAEGLFHSRDAGRSWKRIFRGKNEPERDCTALAILPGKICLGTKNGLFTSTDKGRSWQKAQGEIGKASILGIAVNIPDYFYIASVEGVFRSKDAGLSWEKIFIAHATENGSEAEEETEDADEEERFSGIRYVVAAGQGLYLATTEGVYSSEDRGESWEKLPEYGLLKQEVDFLFACDDSRLYAVNDSGIFRYENERWHELSLRLVAGEVNRIGIDREGNLYAACGKGLFRAKTTDGLCADKIHGAESVSRKTPGIKEVQEAAIKYAEVEPGKIKEWRKKAKMKAILPKLTIGIDRSESTNYEIYTSATTHYVYEGPYDKSDGWDVTLSWELGDLIWNDDQTSIDVRSRLMVELRDDILDEVTKLFFERRRVEMELDSLTIEERKKRTEKELRLEELTAYLDGLTGNYFSKPN
ncbi:MAG: YCF48-related protein [Candidatus Omnitrophota bacterium]